MANQIEIRRRIREVTDDLERGISTEDIASTYAGSRETSERKRICIGMKKKNKFFLLKNRHFKTFFKNEVSTESGSCVNCKM